MDGSVALWRRWATTTRACPTMRKAGCTSRPIAPGYWLGHGAQPSLTVKSFLKKVLAEPAQSEENPAEEDQTEGNGSGESGSNQSA